MRCFEFYGRLLLLAIWFFTAVILSMVFLAFRWKDPSIGVVLARLLTWGALPILGYKVRVENAQYLTLSQPCIYVANHQSNLDVVTMAPLYPHKTVAIGKKELRWIPLFGLFFAGSGMIMIDRKNHKNSFAGLEQAFRAIKEKGLSIWLFPEGTRNRGAPTMRPFKRGAFYLAVHAQVPIVPIVHQHLFRYFDYAHKRILGHGREGREIVIKVLEPIATAGLTTDDVPQVMEDVRRRMEDVLKEPEMAPPHRSG